MYFEAFELKDAALWITFAIVHKSMYYMLLPVFGVFKGIISLTEFSSGHFRVRCLEVLWELS